MAASPLRLLHFADAHIDMVNHGRHDGATGLPVRVMDFLAALDQIVARAIAERVDLVIFAGDAYKDRHPQPTFQREWGRRMMQLSEARIPTILLVGNHDKSPAQGRAHALHEYQTLQVPYIHVADSIARLDPATLGIPAQVITVPWVSHSVFFARADIVGKEISEVYHLLEARVAEHVNKLIDEADQSLPLILTAHASVQGARYGSERQVMLGHELVLGSDLVRNKRLDYVALGHIHRHQDLNAGVQPPVIYPGSIERIDFGEAREKKGYILAEVSKGHTVWEFAPLKTRRFVDTALELGPENSSTETFMADILRQLPAPERLAAAICRLQLTYPREWETLLDEAPLARHYNEAFGFFLAKHRRGENRSRLGDTLSLDSLTPDDLLALYWENQGVDPEEAAALQKLARDTLGQALLSGLEG